MPPQRPALGAGVPIPIDVLASHSVRDCQLQLGLRKSQDKAICCGGCRFGGCVRHWDKFDAACFGLSPSEALLMDPQQRVMLEVAAQDLPMSPAVSKAKLPIGILFACLGCAGWRMQNHPWVS